MTIHAVVCRECIMLGRRGRGCSWCLMRGVMWSDGVPFVPYPQTNRPMQRHIDEHIARHGSIACGRHGEPDHQCPGCLRTAAEIAYDYTWGKR